LTYESARERARGGGATFGFAQPGAAPGG